MASTESLSSLHSRAAALRAQLALLQSSRPPPAPAPPAALLSLLSSLPPSSSSYSIAQPGSSSTRPETARPERVEVEERARRYRVAGKSCFPIELARGKRAREGEGKGKESGWVRKGVVVRLETFCRGRFWEPFYVVFAHTEEEEEEEVGEVGETPRRGLEIAHHTIPPWVPLQELVRRYLGVKMRGQEELSGYADGGEEVDENAKVEPDLDLFLTRLTTYLNAFVSRRQELAALRAHYSTSQHAALDFRIFASGASDRIIVEWNLSTEADEAELSVERLVVLQLAFNDLRSDRVGAGRGTLLARCVERSPESGRAPKESLIEQGERALDREGLGRTLEEVVRDLVEETTAPGWEVAVTE